ncbi:hypothetical protein DPMN_170180 [Dreissena polymorpha]|nr:hypothetical protein DPMN_170180 [Dreissena polymorpha]
MGIGFALANSIMIIAPEGVVIVDVTESYEAAAEILTEFRKITKKPITDIVYTHSHPDHTYGAKAFIEDPSKPPRVWAHESITKGFGQYFYGPNQAHYARSMRQFGVFLPDHLSSGIGISLRYGDGSSTLAIKYPDTFIKGDWEDAVLAGLPLRFVHIPGETDDQIGVWIPSEKAFLCADDLYKAFPNLYAIRGTTSRELMQWVRSIDKIIDLQPTMLVPSHTRAVIGHAEVATLLTEYRDAIQFVHDQTIRLINYGYTADEIGNMLKLPAQLAKNPYLREFYGTVKWSAKSVFTYYEGWFSGDPVDLDPLTRGERADRMVELIDKDGILDAAKKALKNEDFQWALELASFVARTDPENKQANDLRVEALIELGSRQLSNNGRNYYLTSAMEIASGLKLTSPSAAKLALISEFPLEYPLSAFPTIFRADECETRNETVYFNFQDPVSHHYVRFRNGVVIIRHEVPHNWDIKVSSSVSSWKQILTGESSAVVMLATGEISIEGGILAFKSFMGCFDRDIKYTNF